MELQEQIKYASKAVLQSLKSRHLKIAFAESMSGGLLSGSLTRIPGASSALLGSAVCYDAESKKRLLGVSASLLEENGAESAAVTQAMAVGISLLFPQADIILAITGSASAPVNDYQISSPPGTVFICFGKPGGELISRQWSLNGSREEVLNQAILLALQTLQAFLQQDHGQ